MNVKIQQMKNNFTSLYFCQKFQMEDIDNEQSDLQYSEDIQCQKETNIYNNNQEQIKQVLNDYLSKQQLDNSKNIIAITLKNVNQFQHIPNDVITYQKYNEVIIYCTQKQWEQQLQKQFNNNDIEIQSDQNKIIFNQLCLTNMLDSDIIAMTIKSDPRDGFLPQAEDFVTKICSIAYEDNEKHICKFFVRGWILKQLKELSFTGFKDKNGKQSKQIRIFNCNDELSITNINTYSITCKVYVQKKDIPQILDQLQQFKNKVTCTFENPCKFAELRNIRRIERQQRRKVLAKRNSQKQSQCSDENNQNKTETNEYKKLSITTENNNQAEILQKILKLHGFELNLVENTLKSENKLKEIYIFINQLKFNNKEIKMEFE